MAQVLFDSVTKRFGDVVAVNNVSLDIPDGEFWVFVGPSGCGKTTSLRLLAGLEDADRGRIFIGDRLVNDVPAPARDTAIVFQNYALYPHMTAKDNMGFGLKMRGLPRAEIVRRVRDAADVLGIAYLLDRVPRNLSGGERQRVALGRAIVRDPKVFLLDEPLSNLDAQLRTYMRGELVKLHRRLGTTFIYVTHDQVEAMTMATRIIVMNAGRVYQIGTPREVYSHPDNLFVAGFIGSPAMNFIPVTPNESDGALELRNGSFSILFRPPRTGALRAYVGKQIILGIRPEDIFLQQYRPDDIDGVTLSAAVDVVEPIGSELLLYLLVDRIPVVARVDARATLQTGDQVEIVLNRTNVYCFDAATEQAIR